VDAGVHAGVGQVLLQASGDVYESELNTAPAAARSSRWRSMEAGVVGGCPRQARTMCSFTSLPCCSSATCLLQRCLTAAAVAAARQLPR
jgi:hypothetical protein